MNKETTSVLGAFLELRERLKQDILGQHMLVERLLLALLADGHLLVAVSYTHLTLPTIILV